MRKLIAALALFAAPALAEIETTTITGTVYSPSGGAYPGKVTCTLSHAGTTSDGVNQQVVASYYTATINSDGSLSMTLVPNDVITPAGTWYSCEYTVQPVGGRRMTWVKTYSVTTSPDPVALGAVAILDNPSLTLPTISGTANSMMATDGSGGLVSTPALQRAASGNAVKFAGRYDETDSQGDSTIDARRCADYDGDGTLEIADVKSCVETNQANGMTFIISAGTYTGGFKTTINITADNVVVRGMGDATKLVINATCSGSVDSVSDNDGTAENSNLFLVASGADNFTLSDMYIDGGSSRFAAQIIDTNADGSPDCAINSNASTTSCTVGAATWCPADWHDILATGGAVAGLTVERTHVVNADRRVLQIIAGVGSTVRIRQNWFDGTGEHQMSINGDSVSITDNDLINSSAFANAGLQLGPSTNNYAWTITGNRFRKWIGPAIGSEDLNQGAATVMSNVTVTGNTFVNDYSLTASLAAGAAIDLNTGSEANYTIRQWNISGNTFEAVEASDTAGAIILRTQAAATQGGKSVIANNVIKHDFATSAAAKAVVTSAVPHTLIDGNVLDFDGDDTGGSTFETGIMMNGNCNFCMATNNIVHTTGTGASGIGADSADNAVIKGNHIDYTDMSGGTNLSILVTNSSLNAVVAENVLVCAASDTTAQQVRVQNSSENFSVRGNIQYEGSTQVSINGALYGHVTSNRARGINLTYQISRVAGANHWEADNTCLLCYQANGSNIDPDSVGESGMTYIIDANLDGTVDGTTYLMLYGDTQIRWPGQTNNAFEIYDAAGEATEDVTFTRPALTATQTVTPTYLGTNTAAANLPFVRCGNVSVDPPNIATTATSGTATAVVTNLEANAACACSPRADWNDDLITKHCYATAGNLNVVLYNNSGGALDATAQTVDYCCTEQ